jgi:hypothetical protein
MHGGWWDPDPPSCTVYSTQRMIHFKYLVLVPYYYSYVLVQTNNGTIPVLVLTVGLSIESALQPLYCTTDDV